MKKMIAKSTSLLMATLMIASFAACREEGRGAGDEVDANYQWATEGNINGTDVLDSSEIADYSGEHKISLKAWATNESGNSKDYSSSDDVVNPEIKRITGIEVGEWMDNRGSTADVRYGNLITSGNIPDIAFGTGWLESEDVWDVSELIDEYCPTIKARMPSWVWNSGDVNGGEEGKVYGVPVTLGTTSLSNVDSLADEQKTIMFSYIDECCPYIVVREDILKDAYPNAKTQAEIDALFASQGYFTKEDLFDVPINSAEQFRTEFLPNIYNAIRNTKNSDGSYKYQISGNRWVEPMLVTAGSDYDTWDFLGKLVPGLLGAGYNSYNSNFSYWDKQSQRLESMLYQDFYKNEIYEWAKMIDQGKYVSTTGMTTQHTNLMNELSSGYYAIGYLSSSLPTGNRCVWKGETVKYRKVYINTPVDSSRFEFMANGEATVASVKFFKDTVREDELPQLLRWLDFQVSRTADMLYAWGPDGENALFYVDENGNRQYKDEALADQMVYSTIMMGDKVQKYNLSNGTLAAADRYFSFYTYGGSIYHPKCVYDLSSISDLASSYFSSGIVLKDEVNKVGLKLRPTISSWTETDMEGINKIWNKRDSIEDGLKQLLVAGASQSKYDSAWNDLQSKLNAAGWTKSFFNNKATSTFLTINKDYAHLFYNQ